MTEDSFIIRIWCEYSDQEGVAPEYRGVIEHVASGNRRYLPDFQTVVEFIGLYVNQPPPQACAARPKSGVGRMDQVRQWMQRRLSGG